MYNEKYKGHKINIEKEKFMSKMTKTIAVLGVVAGLGVAALPLSSYATAGLSDTANITAQAVVGDSIEITAGQTTVTMTNVVAGATENEASTDLTVRTNNVNGYSVNIKDADTETALKTADGSGTATGIPAGVPSQGTNAWGFKTSSTASNVTIDSEWAAYRAVSTSEKNIATGTTASAAEGDVISLTFGVTVDTTIAAGTYEDVVVVTATTK